MNVKIFYFSGTGNTLFVARKLHEKLRASELIPIVKELKNPGQKIQASVVMILFPVYALTIPLPVRDFLQNNDFSESGYISAVATRFGTFFNDFKRIEKLIKPARLSSQFLLNMGNNDIRGEGYSPPNPSEIKNIESKALEKIEQIADVISNLEEHKKKDTAFIEPLPYGDWRDKVLWRIIPKMMSFSRLIGGVNYFYVNSNCNGCWICSRVCLSEKIGMNGKTPVWNKKILCHMCYACINFCPRKAIDIKSIPGVKSFTPENERYTHPYAGIEDIYKQKC